MSLLDLEVGFEPELETWNLYELADGTTLRLKSLLVKLFRHSNPRPQLTGSCDAFSGRFQTVIAVKESRPELRVRNTESAPSRMDAQDLPRVSEDFAILSEDWSRYRLETGDLLKVKTVVTLVERVDGAWDEFGDPVYAVSSVNVFQTVRKPHMMRHVRD